MFVCMCVHVNKVEVQLRDFDSAAVSYVVFLCVFFTYIHNMHVYESVWLNARTPFPSYPLFSYCSGVILDEFNLCLV